MPLTNNSYSIESFTLSRLVERVLANFNTAYQLEQVKMFVSEKRAENKIGVTENAFVQAIETIAINWRWTTMNADRVTAWLVASIQLPKASNSTQQTK